jgi:hypothetical protein
MMRHHFLAAVVVLAAVAAAVPAHAQIPGAELNQTLVSRAQLDSLLLQFEAAANAPNYSSAVRDLARRRAQLVRQRLTEGDFHVGDRILLAVEGDTGLTDTFTVDAGRVVQLASGVGAVPLQGVLRVELNSYLTQWLTRFIRDPKVHARALIRVVIKGSVLRQGFYTVPVDIPVDRVFESAGGIASTADLDKMKILRGHDVLYEGDGVTQLVTEGITIDAIGIQAGDAFSIDALPVRTMNATQRVQTIQYLMAIPFSAFALAKLLGF